MHGFVSSVPAVSVGYFAVRAVAALVPGAWVILTAHLALRPVARRVDRLPDRPQGVVRRSAAEPG